MQLDVFCLFSRVSKASVNKNALNGEEQNVNGLLAFALVYLVFVLTPGPGLAAIVARGLGTGMQSSLGYAAGFVLGDLVWFTLAATGLTALAAAYPEAFVVFRYLGCCYLLFLAWKIWRAPVITREFETQRMVPHQWAGFMGSLLLTLSNPKVIVFFISVMPLVVDVQHLTLEAYGSMAVVMALVCSSCIFSLLYLATQARHMFRSTGAVRRINRLSSAMLAGAAVFIGFRS